MNDQKYFLPMYLRLVCEICNEIDKTDSYRQYSQIEKGFLQNIQGFS